MDGISFERAYERIQAEYNEMPGMRLTACQIERLSGVDHSTCEAVLAALVRDGSLVRQQGDIYVRGRESMTVTPVRRRGA
jgi:hypothetical protein